MNWLLPMASANAAEVDQLLLALLVGSLAVFGLVFILLIRYIVKYRAGDPHDRGAVTEKSWRFEIAWTAATLLVFFGLFVWGSDLYIRSSQPPANALKVYVIGKQWMWKVEHGGGQREIDAFHLPVGRPIELIMTSEDVIHDFSVPAFRLKHDVLPDRYETLWFTVDLPGHYHLFCTQFCGLDHAHMGGEVVAMSPPDFETWLEQNAPVDAPATAGRALFEHFGCAGCHLEPRSDNANDAAVRSPDLAGLYGAQVPLSDGGRAIADERYLREAILYPSRHLVAGYAPAMPAFAGQISEEEILSLIAYIRSLKPAEGT